MPKSYRQIAICMKKEHNESQNFRYCSCNEVIEDDQEIKNMKIYSENILTKVHPH